jgi:hypothetical protein
LPFNKGLEVWFSPAFIDADEQETLTYFMKGSFHKRLNSFLAKAAVVVREHFHGQLTYASGSWENVD